MVNRINVVLSDEGMLILNQFQSNRKIPNRDTALDTFLKEHQYCDIGIKPEDFNEGDKHE